MPEPDHLRDHERELLRVIACITARVISRVLAGKMTYIQDTRTAEDKYFGVRHDPQFSDEASARRAVGAAHLTYLLAAGWAQKDAGPEAGRRGDDDWRRILALAQTVALDRLAAPMAETRKGTH